MGILSQHCVEMLKDQGNLSIHCNLLKIKTKNIEEIFPLRLHYSHYLINILCNRFTLAVNSNVLWTTSLYKTMTGGKRERVGYNVHDTKCGLIFDLGTDSEHFYATLQVKSMLLTPSVNKST